MKKLLLSSLFASLSLFAIGQADVAITLDSPTANANLVSGTSFNFDVTITNIGAEPIDANDTVIVFPTANGSLISTQSGAPLAWIVPGAIAANGGTGTFSQSLSLTGGSTGTLDICAVVGVLGAGWSGVTESDTTNNINCATVNWSAGGIGISEFKLVTLTDNSFYSNGYYNVRLNSANAHSSIKFELISLTGKVVQSQEINTFGSEVSEDIRLNAPSNGVYIARLTSQGKAISTKKVVIQ